MLLGTVASPMGDDSETVFEANRRFWDASTRSKMANGSYPVESFLGGESTLFDHERTEVGDVGGKSLLHLQCNNGLETLSWAREGADAMGIDISGESLRYARDLSEESGVDAAFVQCNVYDAADALDRQFDVVYTSRGVLSWLPDLEGWADVIARSLTDGAPFYLFEGHPVSRIFDEDFEVIRSYFENEPDRYDEAGFGVDAEHYRTLHRLCDVVNALSSAGLRIEFVHEFPFDYWRRLGGMVRDDAGRWRLPGDPLPLSFSLRATKM